MQREPGPQRDSRPGLGDLVAAVTGAVGIQASAGCGCKGRQQALNAATPNWVRRLLARVL